MSAPEPCARTIAAPASAPGADCWNSIGVMGDRTCPELAAAIHCRNCPVFAAAARAFLDRPAPAGYLTEWTRLLEAAPGAGPGGSADGEPCDSTGVVIFRLGAEWLALRARFVDEVTLVHPVHRIPHRDDPVLAGLTSLRGQLHLCVSLHGLLGSLSGGASRKPVPRMIVIRHAADAWVFTADEVLGVPRVPQALMRAVPSTLANPAVSFSQSVFTWEGRTVGLLDEQRVFEALRSLGP
jgi:chemotaxis-related protein WspD